MQFKFNQHLQDREPVDNTSPEPNLRGFFKISGLDRNLLYPYVVTTP